MRAATHSAGTRLRQVGFTLVELLAALALTFGFFRRGSTLLGNALAILIIAALVYLTLGAGYSCWKWCF